MSSYNYNTENLSDKVVYADPYSSSVANGGYLAIQAGVSGTSYASSTAGTDIDSILTGLVPESAAIYNSYINLYNANPHTNGSYTYTVTAGNTVPANVTIDLLDAQSGNPSAQIGYSVGAGYLINEYGLNSAATAENSIIAYINKNNNTYVVMPIGDNYVSVPDMASLYSAYSSDIPSPWNTASFWQNTTNPQLQQFYNYFCMLNDDVLGEPQGYSAAHGLTPPTSLISFYQDLIQTATIYDPSSSTVNPNITEYNGVSTSNSAAFAALGTIPPTTAEINSGNVLTDYYGNLSAVPALDGTTGTSSSGNLAAEQSQVYSSFSTQYLSEASNFSGVTTPSELINNYLNYLSSPNNLLQTAALNLNVGTTLPLELVAEGSGTASQIGTYTIQAGDVTTPLPVTVAPSLGTSTSPSATYTSVSNTFTSALQTIFDQAYQSSGMANDPAIAAVGESTLFNNTFAAFMGAFSSGQLTASSLQDIINDWSSFVGPSVTLGPSTLTNFQQIYNTFFPNANQSNYLSYLNSFITQFLQSSGGVFNTSLMADQWYAAVQNSYLLANGQTVGNAQPLQESNFSEVKVIFSLYSLLIQVLGDIQNLTASQAQYDNVLVQLEGAYTNEIAGIPDDLIGNTIPGGQNITPNLNSTQIQNQSSWEGQISNATQKWISNITAFNTEVSNNEKNQTTTISQSNEASNQQANLINSILQELQSILQSIWR